MRQLEDEKDYNKLTEKQKRFIDYYVETANATESAKKAGYSFKTAKNIGAENLTKLNYFIQERLQQLEDNRIASQEEVLQYLTKVMRGEEKDQFGLDASLQDRTKCAELLGKRYGTFKEKVDVTGNIPVVIQDDITE
uniref:Terminase small subunit n=1 Tax=Siphoviridae sp. ctylc9 TaxID=2827977 RepID=A0A8S5S8P9_9CAUD|nr:MAG TPA: Terminase small subunit [Siphoviridae sp. ctylc9]